MCVEEVVVVEFVWKRLWLQSLLMDYVFILKAVNDAYDGGK